MGYGPFGPWATVLLSQLVPDDPDDSPWPMVSHVVTCFGALTHLSLTVSISHSQFYSSSKAGCDGIGPRGIDYSP